MRAKRECRGKKRPPIFLMKKIFSDTRDRGHVKGEEANTISTKGDKTQLLKGGGGGVISRPIKGYFLKEREGGKGGAKKGKWAGKVRKRKEVESCSCCQRTTPILLDRKGMVEGGEKKQVRLDGV